MIEKTLLVVEDERPLLEAIKIKLEHNGIDAVTARSVSQAKDYLETLTKIDGVWLDHYLFGNENGLDIVAYLKSSKSKWKHLPIFVVSNTASNEKVTAYLRFGIEKYYVKSNSRLDDIIDDIIAKLTEK